jgi:hypothetical protein
MKTPAATIPVGEPLYGLGHGMSGKAVRNRMDTQAAGYGIDLFDEPRHVRARMTVPHLGERLSGGDVHRREQVDGAVACVVVGHRPGPYCFHRQRRLGAVPCLALRLIVKGEHHRPRRRGQMHAHHVDRFLLAPRIVADLEGGGLPRLQMVAVEPSLYGGPGRTEPALRDCADTLGTGVPESRTLAPHRIGLDPAPPRDLLIRHLISRPTTTRGPAAPAYAASIRCSS